MAELRIPTVALAAEVFSPDGRVLRGRIFVSASAPRHAGASRPAEWINESGPFFPFLPDDSETTVILNKLDVLVVTVAAETDSGDVLPDVEVPERRLSVECADRRFEGTVVIDAPESQRRVLDHLNRPEPFLVLRSGERHHLVQKARITRVVEKPTA